MKKFGLAMTAMLLAVSMTACASNPSDSGEQKLQIVQESVTNSWKGVFPLKGGQAPAARREVERHVE